MKNINYLYILPFNCGKYFKIGISGGDFKRINDHNKSYGINLNESKLVFAGNRRCVKSIEQYLLSQIPELNTNGFTDKSGYTEIRDIDHLPKCIDIITKTFNQTISNYNNVLTNDIIEKCKTDNDHIIQSYKLTTAIYDFNIIQKRFLYYILNETQLFLPGVINKSVISVGDYNILKSPINISYTDIYKTSNIENFREGLSDLLNKEIIIDGTIFKIIDSIDYTKYNNEFTVKLNSMFIDKIMEFDRGYSIYNKDIKNLKSIYSQRLYEIISSYNHNMTHTIDNLKEMFVLSDKYKLNTDFIKIIIERSKVEMSEKCVYVFNYKLMKKGRKFNYITFDRYKNVE